VKSQAWEIIGNECVSQFLETDISMETSGQHTLLIYEEILRGISLCQQRSSLYIFTHHKQDLQYFRKHQTNTVSQQHSFSNA